MTFSTLASPGVSLQGGGGSGSGTASLPISGNGATVTASTPLINGTQTWNNGAVTFTSLLFNVTDTASAAASLLMDLQVGGSSRFNVDKSGNIRTGPNANGNYLSIGPTTTGDATANSAGIQMTGNGQIGLFFNGTESYRFNSGNRLQILATAAYSWGSSGVTGPDLFLTRRAAANLRLGAADAAAPVAQTLSVQSVVAGTTNTAGANLTITGSQGTGTGAGGSIIFQVAPAGSSGTAQNALATALTIDSAARAAFTTSSGTGVYINDGAAGLIYARSADTQRGYLWLNTTGAIELQTTNNQALSLGGTPTGGIRLRVGAFDSFLFCDAANTLALRNGANAQVFRVYNTYTDDSNYIRSEITASSFYQRAAGTGLSNEGSFEIGNMTGTTNLFFRVNGGTRVWYFGGSTGHFLANLDNTYDIGASGASRPRTGYFGTKITAAGAGELGANYVGGINNTLISFISSSVASLQPYSGPGDVRLQFGGTTSSFPALKRVSANLQVIAADNAGSAGLIVGNQALATNATDGFLYVPTCAGTPTGTPTAQTGTVPIVVDTTNNKLYFYSGAQWRDAGP